MGTYLYCQAGTGPHLHEDVYHGKRGKFLVGEVIDEIFPTGLSNHLTTAWEVTEI